MKFVIATAALIGSAQASSRVAIEGRHPGVPMPWSKTGTPAPEQHVKVTVAVKQNAEGKAVLKREVRRRSDPDNREYYGKWLKKAEVDALLRSSDAAVESVTGWLKAAGATDVSRSDAGDFISATMTVRAAEAMLGSHYKLYSAEGAGTRMLMNQTYTVPAEIAEHVDVIGPSWHFPAVPKREFSAGSNPCTGPTNLPNVTPSFLRKLYGAEDAKGRPGTKNSIAIASFINQFFSPSDLKNFLKLYSPDATVTTATAHGQNDAGEPGIEAELDVQYAMGVAKDIPAQAWYTGGGGFFLQFLKDASSQSDDDLFKSVSVSYGEDENVISKEYTERVATEVQKIGARGVTVMISSGDSGFYYNIASFPANLPDVTAVGATMQSSPEVVAHDPPFGNFTSGGGWSQVVARPSWQDAAVQKYLNETGNTNNNQYNQLTGRGLPDVAAQGTRFLIYSSSSEIDSQCGKIAAVDGTSASAPTFNGIVALLNEERLAAGKSTLGPINQLIYKHPEAFNDVTKGNNGQDSIPAAEGWDPATGLGTPNFAKLKEIVLALP